MSSFKLSGKGIYLTAAGYIIELDENERGSKRTSPGTFENSSVFEHKWIKDASHGWAWHFNGTIEGLDKPWSEDLQIIQKLNWKSLPKLPEGYEYKDGFPRLEHVKYGEEFLTEFYSSVTVDTPTNSTTVWNVQHRATCDMYIIIVKKPTPAPEQWYETTDPNYIIKDGDEFKFDNRWNKCTSSLGLPVGKVFSSPKIHSRSPISEQKAWYEITNLGIKPEEPALMPVINGPGLYITEGGYVIQLDAYRHATVETSPYLPEKMKNSLVGWIWNTDGTISGLDESLASKLKIVKKAAFAKIPAVPDGFQWVGGYPQYRAPKKGERYFALCSSVTDPSWFPPMAGWDFNVPYFIIEKKPSLPPKSTDHLSKEEEITPLRAITIKPSLLKRSFNWWVAEPVSNAFRYAVITAVLWGGVEIYKNPAVVWKFLPKISVTIK